MSHSLETPWLKCKRCYHRTPSVNKIEKLCSVCKFEIARDKPLTCLICGGSLGEYPKHHRRYCSVVCRERSKGRFAITRLIQKHALDPIYQIKQLGLLKVKHLRMVYYDY